MQNLCRDTKSFNILSAALSLIFGGIFILVPIMKTGLPIWTVVAGGMVGIGLGLAYLSAQWEKKTIINMVLSALIAVVFAVAISVLLLTVQGSI